MVWVAIFQIIFFQNEGCFGDCFSFSFANRKHVAVMGSVCCCCVGNVDKKKTRNQKYQKRGVIETGRVFKRVERAIIGVDREGHRCVNEYRILSHPGHPCALINRVYMSPKAPKFFGGFSVKIHWNLIHFFVGESAG